MHHQPDRARAARRRGRQLRGWLALAGALLCLAGCFPGTRLRFVVPDQYEGPLIVRYQCPGGAHVVRSYTSVQITFRPNGTACLLESYQEVFPDGSFVVDHVQPASGGATIPWVIDLSRGHGMAFLVGEYAESRNAHNITEASFSEYWVGDLDRLRALPVEQAVEQRAAVYQRLGQLPDGTITLPQPGSLP